MIDFAKAVFLICCFDLYVLCILVTELDVIALVFKEKKLSNNYYRPVNK